MRRSSGGFTLLELVVVLVIGGLLFALAGPSGSALFETMQYRDAVRELVSAAKNGKRDALAKGKPIDLVIDTAKNRYIVTANADADMGSAAVPLPEELMLEVEYAAEVSPGNGLAAIRFYPMGGSSGGEIRIQRPTGAGTILTIDWLLGDVRQVSL